MRRWILFWGRRQIILQKRHGLVRVLLNCLYQPRRKLCCGFLFVLFSTPGSSRPICYVGRNALLHCAAGQRLFLCIPPFYRGVKGTAFTGADPLKCDILYIPFCQISCHCLGRDRDTVGLDYSSDCSVVVSVNMCLFVLWIHPDYISAIGIQEELTRDYCSCRSACPTKVLYILR